MEKYKPIKRPSPESDDNDEKENLDRAKRQKHAFVSQFFVKRENVVFGEKKLFSIQYKYSVIKILFIF